MITSARYKSGSFECSSADGDFGDGAEFLWRDRSNLTFSHTLGHTTISKLSATVGNALEQIVLIDMPLSKHIDERTGRGPLDAFPLTRTRFQTKMILLRYLVGRYLEPRVLALLLHVALQPNHIPEDPPFPRTARRFLHRQESPFLHGMAPTLLVHRELQILVFRRLLLS
jgi:hypothetical protein